jgi:sarcosine oxidase subunit gamma
MPDVDGFAAPPTLRVSALGLSVGPPALRYVLRGDAQVAAAVAPVLRVALPQEACRSASAGARHALWLGPDEWLILAAPGDDIAAGLETTLGGQPHSLVDVSQRQTAIGLSGAYVHNLLSAGCPLDLDLAAFPVGMCTRTLFGKAEIVLWRTSATSFHIEVWRSFSAYVWGLLQAAGADLV